MLGEKGEMGTSNAVLCAAVGSAHNSLQKAGMGNTARTPGINYIHAAMEISCCTLHRIAGLKSILGN